MRLSSIGSITAAFWVAACALEIVATEIPFPASQAFRSRLRPARRAYRRPAHRRTGHPLRLDPGGAPIPN